MAKIKRRKASNFEEKYGDILIFLIGPPCELTAELERDIELYCQAKPDSREMMERWKVDNARELAERDARRKAAAEGLGVKL